MKRIHSTKYNICFVNHRNTKWIIPANEGYFVPLILLNYLEQQCLDSLNQNIDQLKVNTQEKETDAYSTCSKESEHEIRDITILLYYPKDVFSMFCSWIQVGFTSTPIGSEVLRYVYPTWMKWCGIPVDSFFPDFHESFESFKILICLVNESINYLSRLRPDAKGKIFGCGWVRTKTPSTPLLQKYVDLVNKSISKLFPSDYRGQPLQYNSNSSLYQIPQLEQISISSSPKCEFDFFFVMSKMIVELDKALEDRKILLESTVALEIPNWMQLFIDTIALSKDIPVEDVRYHCVEAFNAKDEFWNDVELHVGTSRWEQLKQYHDEHPNKRQKQEYKSYLEQFLDVYPAEFDQELKAKMITQFNWAVQAVQRWESIEK